MSKRLSITTGSEARSSPVPQHMRENGLWVFESRHAESFSMSMTQHSFLKLLWIREGRATIELKTESMACEMGSLVIVPARTGHRLVDSPNAPVSLYGLGVDVRQLKCVVPVLPRFQFGVYTGPKIGTLRIEQQFRKLLYLIDQEEAASQLSSVAVATELLAELALNLTPPAGNGIRESTARNGSKNKSRDPMLEAYLDWLHRNFYESLTLDEAAEASGMSRRTFTSQFKARTGMTWLEYVNFLRVRRAEELLKETDRKVTSIAFQCGFDDLSTFYRAFKRITGRTPGSSSAAPA